MKNIKSIIVCATLALTANLPTTSFAQLGGLFNKKAATGSDAATDGAGFLRQLTPGAVKFSQSYAKYYEALGNAEAAAKIRAAADQMATGGTVTKENQKQLDGARKEIVAATKTSAPFDEAAKVKWQEANGLYGQGLAEWSLVSASVALALKDNPTAVITKPELGLAASLCLKGMKDLTGFVEIAHAKNAEKKEQLKAAK